MVSCITSSTVLIQSDIDRSAHDRTGLLGSPSCLPPFWLPPRPSPAVNLSGGSFQLLEPFSFAMCPLLDYRRNNGAKLKSDNVTNKSTIRRFWPLCSFHDSLLPGVGTGETAISVGPKEQFQTVQPNKRGHGLQDLHFLWCPGEFSSTCFLFRGGALGD